MFFAKQHWIGSLAIVGLAGSVACGGGASPPAAGTPTAKETPRVPAQVEASPKAPPAGASPVASPGALQTTVAKSPSPSFSAPSPAAAQKTGPLTSIKVGWTPSFVFLPLPVAIDSGECRKEGLDVSLVDFQGGAEVTSAMLGKSIEVAATQAERPLVLYEKGQLAKNLMHVQADQAFVLVVRKDLNLQPGNWEALKGMKMGMTRPGSGTDLTLRALLKLNGLEPDKDTTVVAVGGLAQAVAALQAKQIDGAITTEPTVTQITQVQPIADIFLDLRKEGPSKIRNVAFTTLQANDEYIQENPEIVRGLISCVARTQKMIRENPSIAVQPVQKVFPNVEESTLLEIVKNEASTYRAEITEEQIQNLNDIQKEAGILKTDVPYDQVVVGPEFRQLWDLAK